MNRIRCRHSAGRSFASGIFGLILLCLSFTCAWAQPTATQGVLDLRGVDLYRSAPLAVDGEWEYFPGRLLAGPVFAAPEPPSASRYLRLPASWNAAWNDGAQAAGYGVASFRLRVIPAAAGADLALRLVDIHSAYRLWLNGRLVGGRGVVSDNAESERADPGVELVVFPNDGRPLDLVLEVSNHRYRDGGVTASLRIGSEEAIRSAQAQRAALALFFVGGLLVMGCYHLLFYAFRRADRAPLYFGLYCLLWMGNYLASNSSDWVIRVFIPDFPADWLPRIDSGCLFASVPVGYLFFRTMFPREFSSRLFQPILALFCFFILLALLAPLPLLLDGNPLYYSSCLVLISYCLLRLAAARRRGRQGAGYFLAGFAILGLISANDMLYDLQLISSLYLLPVGMFFFIIAQGFALSLNFSRSFAAVERLSGQLEQRNNALREEMEEHARLEREIVKISEDERRSLGHALHDGLCQQLTAARLRCSVLQRNGSAGSHELKLLSNLLDDSVNQAYELSRGLWPAENEARAMREFLEDHCRRLAASTGITIRVWHGAACASCSHPNSIQLCRIAQEAIGNAVKHARAKTIEVSLGCTSPVGQLTLSVRDDGIGRERAVPSPGGLGLRIMAHRAHSIGAALHVNDADGGGTVIRCHIPCALAPQSGAN